MKKLEPLCIVGRMLNYAAFLENSISTSKEWNEIDPTSWKWHNQESERQIAELVRIFTNLVSDMQLMYLEFTKNSYKSIVKIQSNFNWEGV